MAPVQDRVYRLVIVLAVQNLPCLLTKRHSTPDEISFPLIVYLPMYDDRTFCDSYVLPSAYKQPFTVARYTIIFIVKDANPLASLFKHSHCFAERSTKW